MQPISDSGLGGCLLSYNDIIIPAQEFKRSGGRFHHDKTIDGVPGISWDYQGTHYYVYSGIKGGVFVQINWANAKQVVGTSYLSFRSPRALIYWITKNQI